MHNPQLEMLVAVANSGSFTKAAQGKHPERLYLLMSAVCSTGIRVTKLRVWRLP